MRPIVTATSMAFAMALTVVPLLAVHLGMSATLLGVLTASLSFLPMLVAARAGSWVDRFGPRTGLLVATAVLGLAPVAVVVHASAGTLFVTEILLGLGNLLAVVAAQTFTASLGSASGPEGPFGLYTTFVGVGQIGGPVLAGLLAQWYGYVPALATILPLAAFASGLSLALPRVGSGSDRKNRGQAGLGRAASLLSVSGVRLAIVFTFSIAFAQSVFLSFFPVILQAAAVSTAAIGMVLALRALVSTAVRPLLPVFVDWIGDRRRALILMVAIMALASAAVAVSQAVAVAAAVSALAGIAWGLAPPLSMVMVVAGANETELGFALGVRLTVNRLAQLVGPLVIGVVADLASLQVGFVASGLVILTTLGYLRLPLRSDMEAGP